MKVKSPNQNRGNLFIPILKELINPNYKLVVLAQRINRQCFEDEINSLYSYTSQQRIPIRIMVVLLLLERISNLGDETVMEQWVQNPCFQYFCGAVEFQWGVPCDPSDRVHFRKRIGGQGAGKISEMLIDTWKDEVKKPDDVLIDTAAQKKNITYPADSKLFIRVVNICNEIVNKEEVEQRQTYQKTMKSNVLLKQYITLHPEQNKEVGAALCKLSTITGRLVQVSERKLEKEALGTYKDLLENCHKIIEQKKSDNNKINSLHEPATTCVTKGKVHKKSGSGLKVSFASGINSIVEIKNFNGTPNDTSMLEPTLEGVEKVSKMKFKNTIVGRSYKGKELVCDTMIVTPRAPPLSSLTAKNTMQKNVKQKQ